MALRAAILATMLIGATLPVTRAQDVFVPTVARLVDLPAGGLAVAGTAAPGAMIELLEGGAVLARAIANDAGDWLIVPAVEAGEHRWTLRTISADGRYQYLAEDPILAELAAAQPTPLPALDPADFAPVGVVLREGPVIAIADLPAPDLVEVRPGDSLWRIAAERYGDGNRYPEIVAANPGRFGASLRIFPGEVLFLP